MERTKEESQAAFPGDSPVPLESVLCTEELNRRPSRPPDYETENRALVSLAQALADSPRTILQKMAEVMLETFRVGSAGFSLLTRDDGGKRFYWPAIAGVWKPHIGGGTPRDFGPCGDVLDRNAPLLFSHFERRYPYFQPVTPPVEECLLVPFYVEGKAVGTIWVIAHDDRREFDAEDMRQLVSLGRFASSAYLAEASMDASELREEALRQSQSETAQVHEKTVAMNEALMLGAVRQHELTEAAESLNAQLQTEITARKQAMQQEVAARVEAEAAGRRMRFLADASRLLAVSLDYRSTWENMARLAVPEIADYCLIDILEGPALRRTAVLSPNLPPEVREKQGEGMLADVVSHVLKTGRAIVHPETFGDPAAGLEAGNSGRSFESYLCVPLRLRGNTLGTLTLVSVRSGHFFKLNDLLLLEELAHRTVVAFENAQLYADALQAIRGRDDVVSAVAHDLKGPLAMVLRFVQMLFAKPASEESLICDRKHVEGIQQLAQQMNTLIDDLLDIARIEARHLHIGREECPVLRLIHEAMELAHPLAISKALQLKSELPPDLPSVLVDRHRILQVFANLIGNAVKFTPPGGIITVRAERFADDVQFSVQDTGTGISQEEVPHLFDRFWQAKKTAHLGTGLGLFIVKGIVESHEGFIWVESEPGAGSKFLFTLPLIKSARAAG